MIDIKMQPQMCNISTEVEFWHVSEKVLIKHQLAIFFHTKRELVIKAILIGYMFHMYINPLSFQFDTLFLVQHNEVLDIKTHTYVKQVLVLTP